MNGEKVFLAAINAKYIHSNLAVYSLKANAKEYESKVELCEFTINHRQEEIISRLYEGKPKYIGFSCYIWNIEYVKQVAADLKKILPQVTIFVGGPEVSYCPEQFLKENSYIDFVMVGEGEQTFYEYLAFLFDGEGGLRDIDGLVYREHGGLVRTKSRRGLSMDELVFPYRNLEGMDNRIIYYESIRGCPFSCSYCLSSIEKSVRLKSISIVKKELSFFLENEVPQVKFVDRTFNCNHEHAYEIWKYIGEHDNGITNFHFEIGGDLLQKEDFELFQSFRPGLIQFEIGIQSTNPETIKAIRRTMNLEVLKRNIEAVQRGRNIHQHLDLIAGLPYEGYTSFQKSFNDVYAMKPAQFQLGFLKVLDGSYMNEVKEDYGVVYSSKPPYEVYQTHWISYEEIQKLKQVEEMVEVYYNSFQFSASVSYLERFFDSAFNMYDTFGEYYKINKLFLIKHSRLRRYEILWEFANTVIPDLMPDNSDWQDVLRETLTFDLFSRDYVKNPPAFIRPRSEELKKEIRHFLERESEEQRYIKGYEGCEAKQLYKMIYIDYFTIDMLQLAETGEIVKKPEYYIFDYRKRNPLNHSAGIQSLSKGGLNETNDKKGKGTSGGNSESS